MSVIFSIALTTGILSGVWGWISISLGLITWAGFLGCTTYFASPVDGVKGLGLSMLTNISGVFWAAVIIQLSSVINLEIAGYIVMAIVSFLMCIQAQKKWLDFIPGTFIGSCAMFAAEGNWKVVIPSLLAGAVFGYVMKASGLWLHSLSEAEKTTSDMEITISVS